MKRALGLCLGILASLFLIASTARAEDGYRLWLRYPEQSGYAIAAQSGSPMASGRNYLVKFNENNCNSADTSSIEQ